ncbi:MAG: hypothetical protein ACLUIW_11885 [Dysosmobacter welbionis]
MKRRLTKLTAAGLVVLALTGCTGGVPEEVSEEPPVPKNVETTWILVVGQPEGSTCWDAAGIFCRGTCPTPRKAPWRWRFSRCPSIGLPPWSRLRPGSWTSIWTAVSYMAPTATKKELGRPFFSVTMPFLFPDAETAAEVLDSTGGEALNGVLAELGLRGLAYGELGFRYPTTSEGRAGDCPGGPGRAARSARLGMLELSEAYLDCWGANVLLLQFSRCDDAFVCGIL